MTLQVTYKENQFAVGDRVKVTQKIKEGDKERSQVFDGMVIAIKNKGENKSFTVRRIGVQQVGIERIYPLMSPSLVNIEVVRKGGAGARRAKLYYVRDKSKKEIERIYSRVSKKGQDPVKKSSSKGKTRSKIQKAKSAKKNASTTKVRQKASKSTSKKKNARSKKKK